MKNKIHRPRAERRISAHQANLLKLKCQYGHVSWEEGNGQRRCRECRLITKRTYHYGITKEDYIRMLATQNYKCAACSQEKRLCVDHCHKTGRVRGLLCHRCNTIAGMLETGGVTYVQEYLNDHTV